MKKPRMTAVSGKLLVVVFALMASRMVVATTVYDDFGPFPNADWGGTGIPNDAVAASNQIVDGNVLITIAMNATERYSNPAVTDDGEGRFFAGTGSNFGGAGESLTEGALWNFNTYIGIECAPSKTCTSTPKLTDYQIDFYYDFNPAAAFDLNNMGNIDVTASLGTSTSALEQGSENLMFGYLASDWNVPGLVSTAPTDTTVFDPNALGEYQFYIEVNGGGLSAIESVAIEVHVVPVPAAVWLFGSGLLGLVGIARRKKV